MSRGQPNNKKKPRIPEPSPRFILWSALVAAFFFAAVLIFDYTSGQWPGSMTHHQTQR
jgi:hypothetical protein